VPVVFLQLTVLYYPLAAPAPYLVIFTLRRQWSAHLIDTVASKSFTEKPTYDMLISAGYELFEIVFFPEFTVRAISGGSEYDISPTNCAFTREVNIHFLPRYYTCQFHIVSWAIEYSRSEVQKICKNALVAGTVTRDNINSILITLSHPCSAHAEEVYRLIQETVKLRGGYVDDDEMVCGWGYGTLDSVVRTHKGTATRDDKVDSWNDEFTLSSSILPVRINHQARTSPNSFINV
jgi:hypothetical protein